MGEISPINQLMNGFLDEISVIFRSNFAGSRIFLENFRWKEECMKDERGGGISLKEWKDQDIFINF